MERAVWIIEMHPSRVAWALPAGCSIWLHQLAFYRPCFGEYWQKKCVYIWSDNIEPKRSNNVFSREYSLHGSPIIQKKWDTLLPAVTSCVMKRSVLVLIKCIHLCSSLNKDLSAFHLKCTKPHLLSTKVIQAECAHWYAREHIKQR